MKPLRDWIFLSYDEKKDKQKKGKNVPVFSNVSNKQQATAKVVGVGPDVKDIKVGDDVMFDPHVVRELEVGGKKIFVLKDKYIYGKS